MSRVVSIAIFATVAIIMVSILAMVINDQSEEYVDDDDSLYVFVLSGQSNAQYYKEDIDVANELAKIPYETAFYYGTDSDVIEYSNDYADHLSEYSIHSMNDENGDYVIGSLEPGFASAFYKSTGKKCLIINTARGGSSISDFMSGEYLYTYNNAIISDALSKIPSNFEVKKTSWIWIQGESDRLMDPSVYAEDFDKLVGIFEVLGFDSALMSKVRSQWAPAISNIQTKIANSSSNIRITDIADSFSKSDGTMDADGLHYSQSGRNILGETLGSMAPVTHKNVSNGFEIIQILPLLVIIAILVIVVMFVVRSKTY